MSINQFHFYFVRIYFCGSFRFSVIFIRTLIEIANISQEDAFGMQILNRTEGIEFVQSKTKASELQVIIKLSTFVQNKQYANH